MAAISLSSEELGDAIAVDIDQGKRMRLRKRFVNSVTCPLTMRFGTSLFEPVQAIAMALAVDEIKLAVVVDVVAEDGEAGVAKVPVGVPIPFVIIRVGLLKPAVSCEHIGFAVAVDVGDADAVTVLFAVFQVVDPRLVFTEVDSEDA